MKEVKIKKMQEGMEAQNNKYKDVEKQYGVFGLSKGLVSKPIRG